MRHCFEHRLRARSDLRHQVFVLSVVFLSIAPAKVKGCPIFELNRTPWFETEDIGKGVDADIILDVTIMHVDAVRPPVSALARIDHVIKGRVNDAEVKITIEPSSCAYGFAVGAKGIVLGVISSHEGKTVLHARYESYGGRSRRRRLFNIDN